MIFSTLMQGKIFEGGDVSFLFFGGKRCSDWFWQRLERNMILCIKGWRTCSHTVPGVVGYIGYGDEMTVIMEWWTDLRLALHHLSSRYICLSERRYFGSYFSTVACYQRTCITTPGRMCVSCLVPNRIDPRCSTS